MFQSSNGGARPAVGVDLTAPVIARQTLDVAKALAIAPNGQSLLYEGDNEELGMLDFTVDPPSPTTLGTWVGGANVSYSPDGSIIYLRCRLNSSSDLEKYLIDTSGNLVAAINEPMYPEYVYWAPDSSAFVVVSDEGPKFAFVNSGELTFELFPFPSSGKLEGVSWAPTSNRVAYVVSDSSTDEFRLYVATISGAQVDVELILTGEALSADDKLPSWSATGDRLLCNDNEHVLLVDLTGGAPVVEVVTDFYYSRVYGFRPDGQALFVPELFDRYWYANEFPLQVPVLSYSSMEEVYELMWSADSNWYCESRGTHYTVLFSLLDYPNSADSVSLLQDDRCAFSPSSGFVLADGNIIDLRTGVRSPLLCTPRLRMIESGSRKLETRFMFCGTKRTTISCIAPSTVSLRAVRPKWCHRMMTITQASCLTHSFSEEFRGPRLVSDLGFLKSWC